MARDARDTLDAAYPYASGTSVGEKLESKASRKHAHQNRFKRWFEIAKHSSRKISITLRMEPETHNRLKVIKRKTDAKSANEVIINALAFYDEIFQEVEEGNQISLHVRTKAGECIEYDLFEN